MKLERLAAIAEIISSVAIVVTLGYLAVQTGQNTAALTSSSRQQLAEMELNAYYELAEHAGVIVDFAEVCDGNIFTADGVGLLLTLEAWFVTKNHAWREYRNGILDEETWNASMAGLRNIFGFPVTPAIWDLAKDALSPGFVDYVEQEIPEALTPPARCAR